MKRHGPLFTTAGHVVWARAGSWNTRL